MKKLFLLAWAVLMLFSCQKFELTDSHEANVISDQEVFEKYLNLPSIPFSYGRSLPRYLQAVGLEVLPVSDQKATVGRVLFYDTNLSQDRKISCASCHEQSRAFADANPVSSGIFGLKGTRNAMAIANVASFSAHYSPLKATSPKLLWDNRAATVGEQATMAFLNDHEMGLTLDQVVDRVKEMPYYAKLWEDTYGQFKVSSDQILECLTAFVWSMGAEHTKFDSALDKANGDINFNELDSISIITTIHGGYNGDDTTVISTTQTVIVNQGLVGFSDAEKRGRDVFVANCSKCHSPILPFQEVKEACNGLDLVYTDQGKSRLTGNPADNGVFKAPSLRNIELTAPYMHDGRFKSLEAVVDFYSTGVKDHPNLHPEMRKNGSIQRNFTAQEKDDLVAFLKTLTDRSIANEERYSNPFWH